MDIGMATVPCPGAWVGRDEWIVAVNQSNALPLLPHPLFLCLSATGTPFLREAFLIGFHGV